MIVYIKGIFKMIDLHMHSLHSDDGQFSEAELVNKCKEAGVQIMAISDHDHYIANLKASKLAENAGIQYIQAMEISVEYKSYYFHLLAYGFKLNEEMKQYREKMEVQLIDLSKESLKLVQKLGFDICEDDLKRVEKENAKGVWTGEMFAEVLLEDERFIDHPILLPYREGGSRSINPFVNFYWDYFAQGKPCFVELELPDLKEAVDTIHRNGGIAVLAHPGINLKVDWILEDIIQTGIDGIEVCSSYHSQEEVDHYYEIALKNNLIATCGSDYHGKTKPAISLLGFKIPSILLKETYFKHLEKQLKEKGVL